HQHRLPIRFLAALVLVAGMVACNNSVSLADDASSRVMTWTLRDEFRTGAGRENPNRDHADQPTWHFLRTNSSNGPVESRQWLRDGKYVPLGDAGEQLFGSPMDGWAYQAAPPLAPLVGRLSAEYDVGLKFQPGDLLLAPGPDHAVVIAWRSPVAGSLEIQGLFEHAQSCCGVNSRVNWYVERGPSPDVTQGRTFARLAAGESDYGTPTQAGAFHIRDQQIQPDDFFYFIVDAAADGTATPHHGDGTRFSVTLTVRDAKLPPLPSFEKEILPLLARKCHDCHGEGAQESKLDLRTLSEILRGGESGPALVRGEPHNSLIVDLIAKGQMPPGDGEKFTVAELAMLRRWIQAGAPAEEAIVPLPLHSQVSDQDRSHWAFQPPRKTAEPKVRDAARVRTPIDSFLLAKLEDKGLTFSADADRYVLIRRAYFDLIGLPPDPAAVKAFLEDTRPNAYELLIEQLLKSPHYGERWGRHWLDAAGYVDGKLDNDLGTIYPNTGIWRYRDYVIQSLNEDKPFDRFLTEQLAGDELTDWRGAATFDANTRSLLAATGFLRNVDDHTDFPQYGIEKRYEVVNETIDMFSTAVLGLTLECCRCHNHKYDPLPQRDYYRLMACFEPAFNVHAWKPPKERFLADVSPAERTAIDTRNAEMDRQIADLAKAESSLREAVRKRLADSQWAMIPEPIRADVKQALELAADQRSDIQKYLATKFEAVLKITDAQIHAALNETEQATLQANTAQREKLNAEKKTYGTIQALWDIGPVPVSHVHRRGNPKAPGVLVQPGFPQVLTPANAPAIAVNRDDSKSETSGRRLALARWLTQADHPLTARVFVNRVWHHHFGRGIVETLGNFGRSGSGPSHPELLDWLALDFVEHGWSMKRLHQQIMLSTAYRQSSRRPNANTAAATHAAKTVEDRPESAGEQLDPDNRLLWRMNLRRLEAEIVRDAILATAGSLDRTAGGPPVEISSPADGLSEVKPAPTPTSANRRSVYLFARRVYPLKFLEIFDAPIMPVNCTQRMNSSTVLQSLALMNSEFLLAEASRMASRVAEFNREETRSQVKYAFSIVFSREASDSELTNSLAFLDEQRRGYESMGIATDKARQASLADFCQMLLASNEFLYVE
ncbi:MAG: hypothetical protein RIS70_4422, partial [Planctomycetota bacterium]